MPLSKQRLEESNLTIIHGYVPTNDKYEGATEIVYNKLQMVLDKWNDEDMRVDYK